MAGAYSRSILSLPILILGLCLVGCPDESNQANNIPSDPPQDMTTPDLTSEPDTGTTPQDMMSADMPVVVVDMPADMSGPEEEPKCPDLPPCKQGYDYDDACNECVAPVSRACTRDLDCREGETCESVPSSSGNRMIQLCILDPASLSVEVCPGGPSCADNTGDLLAAAVSRIATPTGFETATPAGLDGAYMNFNPPVSNRERWNDCGYDGLCPGDEGYVEPDEGELDGKLQGMWIAGFSAGRPAQYCPDELIGCAAPECCVSKYAHDDIRVQIAVFRQGETTVAFAVVDAVGYFHSYIDAIREEVEQAADIDLLVMSSTHSHESPDTVGQWGPGTSAPTVTGRDTYHMARIKNETIEGIKEAVEALQPARIEVAVLDVGVEGLAMSDSRPPYIFDDNVPVVRVSARDSGEPIATMLSMGNHAEVLWSGNPYISSDYFHFTREYVANGLDAVMVEGEEVKPALEGLGGVTVMFAGAVGGLINPGRANALDYADVEYTEHGYAKADAVGQRLAMHVLQAKRDGGFTVLDAPGLSFATRRFLTPITNPLFLLAGFITNLFEREMYNAVYEGGISFEPGPVYVMSQVAVVKLGPLSFFTAPGEVFPELLVGGYPGRPSTQTPVIGDVEERRVSATCDIRGLPPMNGEPGMFPCIVKADQENPPNWSLAPEPPYVYDLIPGEYPFFIGLGMDFLGYMVPPYDYEPGDAPGSHYEETNGASGELVNDWLTNLNAVIHEVP